MEGRKKGGREGGIDECAGGGHNNGMHFIKHARVTGNLTLSQDALDEWLHTHTQN